MAKFDKNIIFLYSENARIKIKDISSILKKSPQRLKYTLNMIEKDKIIYNPYCMFNYSFFGLLLFRVYFKGGYISEKDKIEIIKKLNENPFIVSIYELSGEFDLALELIVPNPSRFNKELKNIASIIPTLNKYKIILNIVTHIYPRSYLINENFYTPKEIIIGGDKEPGNFTQYELNVMKQLLLNPKSRMSSLARLADLNVKTVASILKSLQKKKSDKGI